METLGKSTYRVCEIVGVVEGPRVYKLGKTSTNKVLKLRYAQQVRYFFKFFFSTFVDKILIFFQEDLY